VTFVKEPNRSVRSPLKIDHARHAIVGKCLALEVIIGIAARIGFLPIASGFRSSGAAVQTVSGPCVSIVEIAGGDFGTT